MIGEASQETSTHKAYQNLSRIMRVNSQNPDTPKIIIIHNAKNLDIEFVKSEIIKVSNNVDFLHVKDSEEYVKCNIEQYFQNKQLLQQDEEDFLIHRKSEKPLRH